MYITKHGDARGFDWSSFYERLGKNALQPNQSAEIYAKCKQHLEDNQIRFAVAINDMLLKLTQGILTETVDILELGAGTGFLTRALLRHYAGSGTLVDNNPEAYKKFIVADDPLKKRLKYCQADIFTYDDSQRYDVVCSFGLLEHFRDKKDIMTAHRKFLKSDGINIIMVPMDTPLSRVYFEVHPELNLGYRELLTEKELTDIVVANRQSVIRLCRSAYLSYDVVAVVSA